jgi:hypothetical protein
MADPAEVAIQLALIARAQAFATAQGLTISLPNIAFNVPTVAASAKFLRASFLPAPTAGLGVSVSSSNQHYGILQIDSVIGAGGGEPAAARIAAAAIAYFKMDTVMFRDGFAVKIWKPPYRGSLIKDDVWLFIPVSIPYVAFASNPA